MPDRVTAHLLGDDAPGPGARPGAVRPVPPPERVSRRWLARALTAGARLRATSASRRPGPARRPRRAVAGAGRTPLAVDLTRLAAQPGPGGAAAARAREALLRGAGLVAGPVEELAERPRRGASGGCAAGPVPVLLVGGATWDPRLDRRRPRSPWRRRCSGRGERVRPAPGRTSRRVEAACDPDPLGAHLSLGPRPGAAGPSRAARTTATLDGGRGQRRGPARRGPGPERRGARAAGPADRARGRLGGPGPAPGVLTPLQELTARARHRDQVLVDWRMRPGGGRGRGVTALFAGDSGTGKTMSAEVIAADLGLDLYTVNLATVVDKYVGETEKNLERIFAEAGGVNAVLFFDEADAIFGKRSEVRDAHDRYANIESAYLLQRLETFDGLAVLATNLRANIDEAFTRRLDVIIDFPAPTPTCAAGLWRQLPGARRCPCGDDVDLDFCADVVRAGRGQHPVGGDDRGVPRRRRRQPGDHGPRRHRGAPGVPQARPAGAREGVRQVPGAAAALTRTEGGPLTYRLGVDLGTTFTAAAVDDGTGPTMLGLGNRALTVPSVVYLDPDGTFLFGEAADRRARDDASRAAREFKRRIGDTVPILVGGQPFSPQALSARLLAWVIAVATERQGGPPDQVVVTHPANWGGYKRELLRQLVTLADVPDAATFTEPEAAATQYASHARLGVGDKVGVYDLGGGTFDVCVLERRETGFAILGTPDGVEHLGGIDFDEAVFQHVLGMLGERLSGLDLDADATVRGLARLRRECVDAKEALSSDVDTAITVELPGVVHARCD